MRHRGLRGRAVAIAVAFAIASQSLVAEAQAGLRPAGLRPDTSSPEAGLWTVSDKAENQAKQQAELNRDPALNEYVRSVACKVAATYCSELRVYVMDRPFFNASMAPNGYMEVWSGALLRANNEAELAFVLGHESGHFAHSHSWQALQDLKSRANGAMIASLLISAVGVAAMANAGTAAAVDSISTATQGLVNVVYLGSMAGMFSFSRNNEYEADAYGHQVASAAAYDPAAGTAVWRRLVSETAASDFPKVRQRETRASIFDTHPVASDRIEALDRLTKAPGGDLGADRYRAAIRPHLSAWLRDDLRRRDFGQTLFVIDQLSKRGEDLGVLNFYRAEAMRLRRKDGDLEAAEQAYRIAIAHPDAPAAAYRELADLAEKRRAKDEMADLLIKYLDRDPAAKDASFIRMRVEQVRPFPTPASPAPAPAEAAPTAPPPVEPAQPESPPAAVPPPVAVAAPAQPRPSSPVRPAPPAPGAPAAFGESSQ